MDRQMWALTTDFWQSRGWRLAGMLLPPMVLPVLILGRISGHLEPGWQTDSAMVILHASLTGVLALCCVLALLTGSDSLGRGFTLPITTWKLVATRLLGGTLVLAAAYTIVCLVVNGLFGAAWPMQGPVFLMIALFPAAQAVHLLTIKSPALGLLAFAPLFLVGTVWFFLRYDTAGIHGRMWTHVTWSEWLTLLTVGAAGVWGSYDAARLQRRGGGPTLAGLMALLSADKSPGGRAALPDLTNSQSALRWREWRERGRVIPFLSATAVLIYASLWWAFSLRTEEAVKMAGAFSMMGALSFLAWGSYLGLRGRMQDFPSFDATRPITDTQWSQALLRNMTRSTLTACGVWILGLGLFSLFAWAVEGRSFVNALGNSLGGEFAHAELAFSFEQVMALGGLAALLVFLWGLACWTISANAMMLALLRRRATSVGIPAGMTLFILAVLFTLLWPQHLQGIVAMILWGMFLTGLVVATLGAFAIARCRNLIGRSTCLFSLVAWLALASVILFWVASRIPPGAGRFRACFALGSLLLLPFLPLAATPLAVAWNRHR